MSPAISRPRACTATLVIDRETASRLGITPQTIDETLYDAFGQRQISTMFTQLNQYHVVLEAMPEFQQNPAELRRHLCPIPQPQLRHHHRLPVRTVGRDWTLRLQRRQR